jgi:hypothetical protein
MMIPQTSPENAAIIDKIKAVLATIPVGSTLAYKALNDAAGCDVQARNRHLLQRAREGVERDVGCAFETVRDVGIQRMDTASIPDIGLAAIRRCRASARRGKKRIDRINTNSMSDSERRRVIGHSAMLGAIYLIADGRKAAAIATVADPSKPIPPENILDMFKRAS